MNSSDALIWPGDDQLALTAALQVATGALALLASDGPDLTVKLDGHERELVPALTLALLTHGAPGVELEFGTHEEGRA